MYFKYKLVVLSLNMKENVSSMEDSLLNSLSPVPSPTSPSPLGPSPEVTTGHALPGSSTVLDIVNVGVNITHMSLPHGAHSLVEVTGRDQMTHKYMRNCGMRQRLGTSRTECQERECQGHSSWWAVLEEMGVDGIKTSQLPVKI